MSSCAIDPRMPLAILLAMLMIMNKKDDIMRRTYEDNTYLIRRHVDNQVVLLIVN